MSDLKHYVRWCVLQLSGVAANESVPTNRLLLVSEQNPETVHAEITVTIDRVIKAAVTVHLNGTVHEHAVEHEMWEAIPEVVFNVMPEEFFAEKILNATFSGTAADGSEMTPAFGDSLSFSILPGVRGKEPQVATTATPQVQTVIEMAAVEAVEFVRPSANAYSAQICMLGLKEPVWVNVDHYAGNDGTYFFARTNDIDFMVGIPPTFHVRTTDPLELKNAIVAFLAGKSNGAADVTMQVHRRHENSYLPLLEGTAEEGVLSEKAVHDAV